MTNAWICRLIAVMISLTLAHTAVAQWGGQSRNSRNNQSSRSLGTFNTNQNQSRGNHQGHNHGTHKPSSDAEIAGAIGGAIMQGLMNSANQNQHQHGHHHGHHHHNNQNYYPRPNNYRPNNNYPYNSNYRPSQSRYSEPSYVESKSAKVKKNTAPPKKVKAKQIVKNEPPIDAGFRLSRREAAAMGEVARRDIELVLVELIEDLGTAADKPKMAALIKQGRDAAAIGTALPRDYGNRLAIAASDAGMSIGDAAELRKKGDTIQVHSQFNAALTDFDRYGGEPGFPVGTTNIFLVPALPADDFCILPGGECLIGTGGRGELSCVRSSPADLIERAIGKGDAEPEGDSELASFADSGLLIINPEDNDVSIDFVLDKENQELSSGESEQFFGEEKWSVRFDRGDDHGQARYSIRPGTYVFSPSEKGWELYRRDFTLSIDNSGNECDFECVVDNELVKIDSGRTKKFSSDYPIIVRFDRGDGDEEALKQVIQRKSVLNVAVDPDDGLWNLFAEIVGPDEMIAESEVDSPRKSARSLRGSSKRSARLMALLQEAEE